MREADRIEISAMRHSLKPDELAQLCVSESRFGFVIGNGEPIAAFGAIEAWPGRYNAWMFATDKWPEIALSATKQVKKKTIPDMIKAGLKLGFCFTHSAHLVAHRWLKSIGFTEDAELPIWGRNGEPFKLMVWRQ